MLRVQEIMTRAPSTVTPEASVTEAHNRMRVLGVRHLPVVTSSEGLVGIISDRDVSAASPVGKVTSVARVMASDVFTVRPETPVREAARLMVEHHVGALPVIGADDAVIGIVSYVDVLRCVTW